MAPAGVDDLHMFLYYCLQNCTGDGKINWDAVAVATGSTKGAVAMRYRRLKEKIEGNVNSGGASTPSNAPATPPTAAGKGNKKSTGSRKRKAAEVKDEEDDSNAGVPQLDGSADETSTRRLTRGKALNYDISTAFVSDDEMSLISFENGDTDYVFNPATAKSDDEDEYLSGSANSVKLDSKRFKKSHPTSFTDRLTPTPCARAANLRKVTTTAKPTAPKHGNANSRKTAAPANEKELPSKVLFASQPSTRSTMHASQKPLPSIEFSPSPVSNSGFYTKQQQSVTDTDSEADLKRLKPGTLLSFPSKRQPQLFTSVIKKPLHEIEGFSSPITIATSVSSSHDSAGKMLKRSLAEHILQLELRPEDSISNASVRTAEDIGPTPVTPTGLVSNTVRFFKGFLTPQT